MISLNWTWNRILMRWSLKSYGYIIVWKSWDVFWGKKYTFFASDRLLSWNTMSFVLEDNLMTDFFFSNAVFKITFYCRNEMWIIREVTLNKEMLSVYLFSEMYKDAIQKIIDCLHKRRKTSRNTLKPQETPETLPLGEKIIYNRDINVTPTLAKPIVSRKQTLAEAWILARSPILWTRFPGGRTTRVKSRGKKPWKLLG